ncbi:carboxylating nicotinate-nucleotide diphosphorylase [Sciscionella marina]|uniref:carboxylating nicotinate-nucleotide diphosphorylase n=1 Tax=Sciscionella marina TaxID=508770 RepID=UPI000379BD17|nr:carboxylating nicotinate-nucleotide diphosphorylase [Sciscionella marina]
MNITELVANALAEDLRYGPDATSAATIGADLVGIGRFTARAEGVLAGVDFAERALTEVAGEIEVLDRIEDGSRLRPGSEVFVVRAPVRAMLTAERTALNFLTHLSGIAGHTARWVAEAEGTDCRIRDTRKTLPGLRAAQKYAVRCGGGVNHRFGLGDAVLVKDNHVVAAGSVTAAIKATRLHAPELPCEVEVDDLAQFEEALAAGASEILLDNFSAADCALAVRRRDEHGSGALLEASGGLSIEVAAEYARSGVDYLAVGALTHSSPALDIALDLDTH